MERKSGKEEEGSPAAGQPENSGDRGPETDREAPPRPSRAAVNALALLGAVALILSATLVALRLLGPDDDWGPREPAPVVPPPAPVLEPEVQAWLAGQVRTDA